MLTDLSQTFQIYFEVHGRKKNMIYVITCRMSENDNVSVLYITVCRHKTGLDCDQWYRHRPRSSNSLPSVGLGADPGVQVATRGWLFKSSPAVGCRYFPPGLRSPYQPKNITIFRPLPSYTAWWQRHIGVNNLPKVVTQLYVLVGIEPRPVDCKSNTWTLCHCAAPYWNNINIVNCI